MERERERERKKGKADPGEFMWQTDGNGEEGKGREGRMPILIRGSQKMQIKMLQVPPKRLSP